MSFDIVLDISNSIVASNSISEGLFPISGMISCVNNTQYWHIKAKTMRYRPRYPSADIHVHIKICYACSYQHRIQNTVPAAHLLDVPVPAMIKLSFSDSDLDRHGIAKLVHSMRL
jgi:hypothetical protein